MTAPARRPRVMRNSVSCAPPICVDRSGHVCRCEEATASNDARTESREEVYRNAPGIQQSIYRPRRVQVVERHEARNKQSEAHATCTDLIRTAASGATSLMSIHALSLCVSEHVGLRFSPTTRRFIPLPYKTERSLYIHCFLASKTQEIDSSRYSCRSHPPCNNGLRQCARSKCAVRRPDDDVADMHY